MIFCGRRRRPTVTVTLGGFLTIAILDGGQ